MKHLSAAEHFCWVHLYILECCYQFFLLCRQQKQGPGRIFWKMISRHMRKVDTSRLTPRGLKNAKKETVDEGERFDRRIVMFCV